MKHNFPKDSIVLKTQSHRGKDICGTEKKTSKMKKKSRFLASALRKIRRNGVRGGEMRESTVCGNSILSARHSKEKREIFNLFLIPTTKFPCPPAPRQKEEGGVKI